MNEICAGKKKHEFGSHGLYLWPPAPRGSKVKGSNVPFSHSYFELCRTRYTFVETAVYSPNIQCVGKNPPRARIKIRQKQCDYRRVYKVHIHAVVTFLIL